MQCKLFFLKEKKKPILPVKLPPSVNWKFLANQDCCEETRPSKGRLPFPYDLSEHWSGATLKYWGETRLSESRLARSSRIVASDKHVRFSQVGYFSLSTHLSLSIRTVMKQHEFKCLKVVLNFFSASHMQQKKNGPEKEIWAICTLIAFHC